MFYGFTAAWLIVLIYVISLARRGARLKREVESVKHLVGTSESERDRAVEPRVR
jgi:CcmD family protein